MASRARSARRLLTGDAAIQALLDLRTTLAVVPALRTALSPASSSLLVSIRDVVCSVPALQTLAERIDQLLDDEVCSGKAAFIAVTQRVFAIRTGVDGFLDVGARGGAAVLARALTELAP